MSRFKVTLATVAVLLMVCPALRAGETAGEIVSQVRRPNLPITVGRPVGPPPGPGQSLLLTPRQGLYTLFSEGFEGAFPGSTWTLYGAPTWGLTTRQAYSGSRSIHCAAGGSGAVVPPANYPANMDAWASYGPFNTTNVTAGQVSLQVRASLPATPGDYLFYGFSTDNINYSGVTLETSTDGWEKRSLNFSSVPHILGGQAYFAVRFVSDGTKTAEGVYVDEVIISADQQTTTTYEINGVARDEFGQPLAGAVISCTPGSYVYTDFQGGYSFRLPKGTYTVEARRAGYQFTPASQAVTLQSGSQVVNFDGVPRPGDGQVNYHAVLVGISDYIGTGDDLNYPAKDAQDLRDALLSGSNWKTENITLVLNSQATRAKIISAINAMVARADGDDVCLLFLSGHGGQANEDFPPIDEHDGKDEVFWTYDLTMANAIIDDELGLWFSSMPTEAYGVIVDTCNSGGHIRNFSLYDPPPGVRGPTGGLMGTQDLGDNLCGVVITACRDNELSQESSGLQNGIFAHYVCEALRGAGDLNRDGWVSVEEAWSYARPRALRQNPEQSAEIWDGYPGELQLVKQETLVAGSTPTAGITGYRRSGTITLNLRERAVQGTVESRFQLTDASGRPVSGTFSWPLAQRQMVFQPDAPLRADERYTVALQPGVRLTSGTVVRHHESFNFTTGNEPVVVAFAPTGNNVSRNANIAVTFDFPMHKQSLITNANFSFEPAMPFVLKTLQGGLQATLIPTGKLAANTTYTVTMRPACRSVDGRNMAYLKTWTFTTGTDTSAAALLLSATAHPARGEVSPMTVQLTAAAEVTATICNLAGREIARIPAGTLPAGMSTLVWNGRQQGGLRVPSGTYFVRLEAVNPEGQRASCLIPLQRRP